MGTQLPVVFQQVCYCSLRCPYPNFLQGKDNLLFLHSTLWGFLPEKNLSPKLHSYLPLMLHDFFFGTGYILLLLLQIFLRAGTLILCFTNLDIHSLNTASTAWQILNKMNGFKLHLESNSKIHISKKPHGIQVIRFLWDIIVINTFPNETRFYIIPALPLCNTLWRLKWGISLISPHNSGCLIFLVILGSIAWGYAYWVAY